MENRTRRGRCFTLHPDVLEQIEIKAVENNTNVCRALDMIVQEWLTYKLQKPVIQLDEYLDVKSLLERQERACRAALRLTQELTNLEVQTRNELGMYRGSK